jgi:hypothetical protein
MFSHNGCLKVNDTEKQMVIVHTNPAMKQYAAAKVAT